LVKLSSVPFACVTAFCMAASSNRQLYKAAVSSSPLAIFAFLPEQEAMRSATNERNKICFMVIEKIKLLFLGIWRGISFC